MPPSHIVYREPLTPACQRYLLPALACRVCGRLALEPVLDRCDAQRPDVAGRLRCRACDPRCSCGRRHRDGPHRAPHPLAGRLLGRLPGACARCGVAGVGDIAQMRRDHACA
jgi:hypothetical protein